MAEIGETLDEIDLYNMNYMDDEYVSFFVLGIIISDFTWEYRMFGFDFYIYIFFDFF